MSTRKLLPADLLTLQALPTPHSGFFYSVCIVISSQGSMPCKNLALVNQILSTLILPLSKGHIQMTP
jgi:hypothetical protein